MADAGTNSSSALQGYRVAAELHHRLLTGMILSLVLRAGEDTAAEAVYRLFRRQHREKFLPGLKLLGLDRLPDAVASAQYHYLSNAIGTVKVEYVKETDQKAWVRYPPPRWVFDGTAICGIPDAVTIAMMRGWHAQNGEALDNPRLGFVCTGMTTAGDPGLEGYFQEFDQPLAPEERLRFTQSEHAPAFDPATAPKVDAASWPEERLAKAERNYSTYYVRSLLCVLPDLLGDAEMGRIAGHAARLVGMQCYDWTREAFDLGDNAPGAFAECMRRFGNAMGDEARCRHEGGDILIEQSGWSVMRGVDNPPPVLFDVWNELWIGACAAHDRNLSLTVTDRMDRGDPVWRWRLSKST